MNTPALTPTAAEQVDRAERIARLRDELARSVDALARCDEFLRNLPARFEALGEDGSRFEPQELARATAAALSLRERLGKSVQELRVALKRAERAGMDPMERIRLAGRD